MQRTCRIGTDRLDLTEKKAHQDKPAINRNFQTIELSAADQATTAARPKMVYFFVCLISLAAAIPTWINLPRYAQDKCRPIQIMGQGRCSESHDRMRGVTC